MDGRFLHESTLANVRSAVEAAHSDGVDAVFVGESPLGDAITLAAAIGTWVPDLLIGVRVTWGDSDRLPSLVARELSTLDHLTKGRTLVTLDAPFLDDITDVLALWRTLWTESPVVPLLPGGPPIALNLTDGTTPPPALLVQADLALVAPTGAAPTGIDVCQILNA